MKSDVEVLSVINFRHMPFQYYQKIYKIRWTCIGPEMNGEKAKKLVAQLQDKLKNFKKEWGTISCSLSLLSEFHCAQIHGKRIDGGWSSVHFHCSDSSKVDNIRRRKNTKE